MSGFAGQALAELLLWKFINSRHQYAVTLLLSQLIELYSHTAQIKYKCGWYGAKE